MLSLKPDLRIGQFLILDNIVMLQIQYKYKYKCRLRMRRNVKLFYVFIFLCFQLSLKGPPGPLGLTGRPGPVVRNLCHYFSSLFQTFKKNFSTAYAIYFKFRLFWGFFGVEWILSVFENVCLFQGLPGPSGLKGDSGEPGPAVRTFPFDIPSLHSVAFKIISLSVSYSSLLRAHVGCQVLLVLMGNQGKG